MMSPSCACSKKTAPTQDRGQRPHHHVDGCGWRRLVGRPEPRLAGDAPEAIKLCLEWGGDVNAANDVGYTALHGAAFRGANEAVTLLVEKGARMDVKNQEGRIPVNMAEGMHIGPGGWVEHDDTVALHA